MFNFRVQTQRLRITEDKMDQYMLFTKAGIKEIDDRIKMLTNECDKQS